MGTRGVAPLQLLMPLLLLLHLLHLQAVVSTSSTRDDSHATAMCSNPAVSVGSAPDGCFLYFAYGSNLLAERLLLANPSAVRAGAGRLRDYRLAFGFWSQRWGGAVATLLPAEGHEAWGAVWAVAEEHRASLDTQEGVAAGIYEPFEAEVEAGDGHVLRCRTYRLVQQPSRAPDDGPDPHPTQLTPSKIYWQVIVAGAQETGLPADYVRWLQTLPHNNYTGGMQVGALAEGLRDPLAATTLPPSPTTNGAR